MSALRKHMNSICLTVIYCWFLVALSLLYIYKLLVYWINRLPRFYARSYPLHKKYILNFIYFTTKQVIQLILIMFVGTDVCVRMVFVWEEPECPEETHLSDLVTTWWSMINIFNTIHVRLPGSGSVSIICILVSRQQLVTVSYHIYNIPSCN